MPGERISRIGIEGFKSLRKVSVDLTPLTVLIGANGAGKSNFIEFFQMLNYAFGSTQGNLQLYISRRGKASSLLYYGPRVTRFMDAAIQFVGTDGRSDYLLSLNWGAPDELSFASEVLTYQRYGRDPEPRSKELGSGQTESRVLEAADDATDLPLQKVARVFRNRLRQIRAYHFHDTSEDSNIRITQDVSRDQYLLSNGGNLAVFLHAIRERQPAHYKRIVTSVQVIAPFIKDFQLDPEPFSPRSVMLRWMDRSGQVFGPHQLSDGTLRAIALITALLQPEVTLPSIMLFDEPELGLHPAGIAYVASLLRAASEKRQVIVATQSPILLREADPRDVIVVDRMEDDGGRGESTFTRLDPAALRDWLADYDLGELYEKNVTGGYPR